MSVDCEMRGQRESIPSTKCVLFPGRQRNPWLRRHLFVILYLGRKSARSEDEISAKLICGWRLSG